MRLGLTSEEKAALCKKYPTPKNCVFFNPPKLNIEVNRAISDNVRARDKRIMEKQEKLAAGMSSIGKAISMLLSRDIADNIPIVEALSDASRLFAEFMHDENLIRRSLILTNVSTSIRETLNATSVDEFLFGCKLVEDLKTAKLVEQSAEDLRLPRPPQQKLTKNSKGPPQRPSKGNAPASGGQRQTNSSQRGHRSYPMEHRQQTHQTSQTSHSSQRSSTRKSRYPRRN